MDHTDLLPSSSFRDFLFVANKHLWQSTEDGLGAHTNRHRGMMLGTHLPSSDQGRNLFFLTSRTLTNKKAGEKKSPPEDGGPRLDPFQVTATRKDWSWLESLNSGAPNSRSQEEVQKASSALSGGTNFRAVPGIHPSQLNPPPLFLRPSPA